MVECTITLNDGITHVLRYPNNAVRRIDKELGYSAMHIVEKSQKHGLLASLGLSDIATVVWGGMLYKRPGQTVDQVADLIPLRPLEKYAEIAECVMNAIMDIYGLEAEAEVTPEQAGGEGNEQADRGTGTGKKPKK